MAWMFAIGPCVRCRRIFEFNPDRVPSLRIHGEREPVCRECFEHLNKIRIDAGLDPWTMLPGAYDAEETA
jgi:hypothetical protein